MLTRLSRISGEISKYAGVPAIQGGGRLGYNIMQLMGKGLRGAIARPGLAFAGGGLGYMGGQALKKIRQAAAGLQRGTSTEQMMRLP